MNKKILSCILFCFIIAASYCEEKLEDDSFIDYSYDFGYMFINTGTVKENILLNGIVFNWNNFNENEMFGMDFETSFSEPFFSNMKNGGDAFAYPSTKGSVLTMKYGLAVREKPNDRLLFTQNVGLKLLNMNVSLSNGNNVAEEDGIYVSPYADVNMKVRLGNKIYFSSGLGGSVSIIDLDNMTGDKETRTFIAAGDFKAGISIKF